MSSVREPASEAVRNRRTVLGACSGTHFIHDGFSDVLYLLLPLWQTAFGLSLAEVGMVRSLYSAALATIQLPIGFLAEWWGERRLLAMGTALTGLAFVAAWAIWIPGDPVPADEVRYDGTACGRSCSGS